MTTEAPPWIKFWWTWFSSRSHIGLSGVALASGPALMLLAKTSPASHQHRHQLRHGDALSDELRDGLRDGKVVVTWILEKNGKVATPATVAAIIRFPVDQVATALQELVDCETLLVSDQGAYGFPNFRKYQESPSAERTRKWRDAQDAKKTPPDERHGDGHGDARGDGKRAEVRGKRDQEGLSAGARGAGQSVPPHPAPPAQPPANQQQHDLPLGDDDEDDSRFGPEPFDRGRAERQRAVEAVAADRKAVIAGLRAGYGGTPPDLSMDQLRTVVARCQTLLRDHRQPDLQTVAKRISESAGPGTSGWVHNLARCDPWLAEKAKAQPHQRRDNRLPPSPGTSGKDFENDMSFEDARRVARGEVR